MAAVFIPFSFSGCVRYEARYRNIFLDGKDPGWLMYKNDFYIPEYTQTKHSVFAKTKEDAEMLFELRRHELEPILKQKYEKPKRQAFDYIVPPMALLAGPVADILYMPFAWFSSLKHPMPKEYLWFPVTREGINGVFYGPDSWEILGPSSPMVKKSWEENPKLEQDLEKLLKKKEFNKPELKRSFWKKLIPGMD